MERLWSTIENSIRKSASSRESAEPARDRGGAGEEELGSTAGDSRDRRVERDFRPISVPREAIGGFRRWREGASSEPPRHLGISL